MGLRDITIPWETVEYGGTDLTVRGVTFADLAVLSREHAPTITMVVTKLTEEGTNRLADLAEISKAVRVFSQEAPELIGSVIALASDDYSPETVDIACDLPFNVQLELVEAIFRLTFRAEGDVEKLIGSLTRVIEATSGALKAANDSFSPIGIGGFEGK